MKEYAVPCWYFRDMPERRQKKPTRGQLLERHKKEEHTELLSHFRTINLSANKIVRKKKALGVFQI